MEDKDKIFTLLKDLGEEDYLSLIEQEELRSQGHKLHFVIDADLIGNYCYPKGIIEEETRQERRAKLNPDYLADEQVTLHSIFYLNKEGEKVIFLNQYSQEFEGMLIKAIRYNPQNKNVKFDFELPNIKLTGINQEFREMLFDSFSKLYATVLVHINGLTKATNLFKDKALIFESKDFGDDFLTKTAELNVGTLQSTEIIKSTLINIFSKGATKTSFELFPSKKRDALIIDRVVSFNKHIQSKGKGGNKKHVFIFLSDSSVVKKTFVQLSDNKEFNYPKIGDKKILLVRNVPQTFAHLISLSYHEDGRLNDKRTIDNIKKLKDASKEVNLRFEMASSRLNLKKDELLNEEIFENYKRIRNAFENTGMLKSFDKLYEAVKEELKEKDIKYIAEIFQLLKDNSEVLQKEISVKHIEYLRSLRHEATFNTVFIYGLDNIRQQGHLFDLSKGADYVEGSYQHLPVFLTFPKETQNFQYHMNFLIRFVLERKTDDSKAICNELESILELMMSSKYDEISMIEVNLLKTFFFMILPSYKYVEGNTEKDRLKENDLIAYKWLNEMKEINLEDTHLNKDMFYLLTWACRRIKKYDEAVRIANKGIEFDNKDPRFYHGKFLAKYCILEDKGCDNLSLINEILELLELSHDLYLPFLKNNFGEFETYSLMVNKVDDTYYNSKCYCLALKANILRIQGNRIEEINKDLISARELLEKLRIEKKFKDKLPEYFDTEAFLEYIESYYSNDKLEKVKNAEKAIRQAIKLSTHPSLTEKYSTKLNMIELRIADLSNQKN